MVGIGFFATRNNACGAYSNTWADYGRVSGVKVPRIPSAAHRPESGDAMTRFEFRANYYDRAGDPTSIGVVIDGTCHPMEPELGASGNRTYLYTSTLGSGCHEYYFLANAAGGVPVSYPGAGAFVMSVEGVRGCTETSDWRSTRLAASCDGGIQVRASSD